MSEWRECNLGDVLNLRRGYDLPHSEMKEGNIPVAGSNGIIGSHNIATSIEPCITVGRSGSAGSTFFYDKAWAHNTTLYIDDFKGNDPKYLYYLLLSLPLKKMAGGSAVPSLNRNHIHPLRIKFPKTLETQRRIASILSSLDDKIAINRRICENLEAQAQALFKHWFIDFAPFKDGKFVESELGMIPEGWRVGTLGEFVDIKYGKDHKKLNEGNIPAYGSAGLMRTVDNNLYDGESILIPRKGTLNNIMYVNEAFWTVDTMFYTIPKKSNILKYVYWRLKRIDFNKMNVGTSIPSNSTSQLNKLEIVVPTDEILSHFDGIMSCLLQEIMHSQKESKGLVSLRDTLLPKLMSGQIKV